MTRRGSRAEGRTPDQSRPPASYATGTPNRDAPMRQCACGAVYRDHDPGHCAHHTVFGHNPIRKPAPATAESAPNTTEDS